MDIFPHKTPSELESEIIECPICLESFGINENRPYCLSNCCHKFHQHCILKVLEKEEAKAEDERALIKVTVPCPMCKEPVKRKHVKLDAVFSRILDNSVKYYSQFYTPLRMPTIEEYRAAAAEFKKIIDCVCDIQDELINEFEAEMAFMKKKTMINRICICGEAVGIVVSIFHPIAGAIIIAGSNGIRLGANLYQVHLKSKRRKKIESLLMRKRECYQVDRIQKFLACLRRLSSREIEVASQNTKVMAALTGGTVLAIVIEEAVVPLNLLTAAISTGVGAGLGVISLATNITISAVEKRNFDKQTQTYESFIKALKQEKEGITHHYKEIVKNFDTYR